MKILVKIYRLVEFALIYIWKVLQSNVYVAIKVISPSINISPAIVEIPVYLQKKASILLFFNLITMTPGTLSMDLGKNRKSIFVHTMDLNSEEKFKHDLLMLEKKIQQIFEQN
jgi:multicomponent Na+:H+ antiporter subunit E